MGDWFSGDVIANGIRIHYYRTGGDKPPVVLCHGATDNGLCWVRTARELESEFDVIMPDARGHGRSEAPESGYGPTEHAADLADFIRVLGLERPAIGGHSMGASTAFYAAANYPGLARCAILEDPPFWQNAAEPKTEDLDVRRAQMRQTMTERKAMTREAVEAMGRQEHPNWADEEFEPWVEAKQQVSLSFAGAWRIGPRLSWQEALPRISCPVVLITGDPDKGGIVTPELAEEAKGLSPFVQVVRLSGAGHNVRREQSDGFIEAVRTFLREK